ncbi:phospholipase D-like domain-containing protein, partial [Pseudomonas knackmussii]|uniref:phospholipase D-like domain-containing protein n=1 Tax=Pseudomonas knackmussii TaxID=65741 RepID=UPI003BD10342
GVDKALSDSSIWTMANSATHHQKMVLVDYELPADTVGFVMGHNMLDEYWDTDDHTALRREKIDKPPPNRGPRGFTPRQDISCRVTGPILEYLHRNFAQAWQKETGEELPSLHDDLHESAKRFPFRGGNQDDGTALMAQLLRTQAQVGVRD